jgi:hypothetical protein
MSDLLAKLQPLIDAIYARLPKKVQDEITLDTTIAVGVVNVLQAAVIPLPPAAHIAIAIVSILAAAIGVRGSVTPESKAPSASASPPPGA